MMTTNTQVIFDFKKDAKIDNWRVVDDVVMGGRSDGQLIISEEGHGVFKGNVSLENNGGFSSIRYRFKAVEVQPEHKIRIHLKGDGNKYQFRVKHNQREYYSYINYFSTTGEWEIVELNLSEMYATFRGRILNFPNFDHQQIEEIAFLIGNKKEQNFELQIDKIELISL